MYELIKSVSASEVETSIMPAIYNAPIDGTRLTAWGATQHYDRGRTESQIYLYDSFDKEHLRCVVWNGRRSHYELNPLRRLSHGPIRSDVWMEYDKDFNCFRREYTWGKYAVPFKYCRICLHYVTVDCISDKVDLVLMAQMPGTFDTPFCVERLWNNRRSVASDLVKAAKSTYDGANVSYHSNYHCPRFAVLYGKTTSDSGEGMRLFIFDRASAKYLYMRRSLTYDSREVFAVPMTSVIRVYTDNPEQIKDTARKYLSTGIFCKDFDHAPVELIAVDDDMRDVESVRLYLDI